MITTQSPTKWTAELDKIYFPGSYERFKKDKHHHDTGPAYYIHMYVSYSIGWCYDGREYRTGGPHLFQSLNGILTIK